MMKALGSVNPGSSKLGFGIVAWLWADGSQAADNMIPRMIVFLFIFNALPRFLSGQVKVLHWLGLTRITSNVKLNFAATSRSLLIRRIVNRAPWSRKTFEHSTQSGRRSEVERCRRRDLSYLRTRDLHGSL